MPYIVKYGYTRPILPSNGAGDTLRGFGLSKEGETAINLLTKIMQIYSVEMP